MKDLLSSPRSCSFIPSSFGLEGKFYFTIKSQKRYIGAEGTRQVDDRHMAPEEDNPGREATRQGSRRGLRRATDAEHPQSKAGENGETPTLRLSQNARAGEAFA